MLGFIKVFRESDGEDSKEIVEYDEKCVVEHQQDEQSPVRWLTGEDIYKCRRIIRVIRIRMNTDCSVWIDDY